MRKDVKFGLTIGAILVITLVIYVIVLSRGPSTPQKIAVTPSNQTDQASAESTDSGNSSDTSVAAHTDDAKGDADGGADTSTSGDTAPPPAVGYAAPATQPTAAAQTNSDWESALNHGAPVAIAAPERTVTPTIDPVSPNMAHGGVSRASNIPLIDPLPSTQPSRSLMAEVPTLEAPAVMTPPPASPTMAQDPEPSMISTPSASSNTPRTHRVMSGESPYSISEMVYGSGKYYKRILAANPGIDPKHLKIGQMLIIPELSATNKPVTSSAASTAGPQSIDANSSYEVRSGDSLESISRKLYGTPRMMDQLYEANKTLIGADENVLKIGWILKLPQAPTAASAQR
jgi:nucleoid-associated protein YgaU